MLPICQAVGRVLVNCWVSRKFICFLLLSFRTSSSSHQRALTRLPMTRMLAWLFLQSIILFDLYRDHTNNSLPACCSAFTALWIIAFTIYLYNSYTTRNTFYGMCICPMHAVSHPIIQTSTVQGHPSSNFIVPIKSPFVVCYPTYFESNIVSINILEIFAAKIPGLDLQGGSK